MPTIYDNIENSLIAGLQDSLTVSHKADFCVGYFNLRGWKEVADFIEYWQGGEGNCCRLLIGMQRPPEDVLREYFKQDAEEPLDNRRAVKLRQELARQFRDQLTIGFPTNGDEDALRKLSRQIKDKKVVIKLFLRHTLHAKLYLAFRHDKISPLIGYLGSSNLTLAGLSKQGELNIDVLDQDAAQKLATWFEDRWNDRWCLDISEELAAIIDESWAGEELVPPYHIYLKMVYHLSHEARAGLSEFRIPAVFQRELLEFQQKALLFAARHVNKRGGVFIGDVVGLGKTITATALAKILEEDFFLETLVICPKNLVDMWEDYFHKYQLRGKVMSITRVQKTLPNERRYRVVIIDESHNLRNREGMRYRAIQEYIALNESKVILLSATPYNKSYVDLSNQLRLFIADDRDLGVAPERYIGSIGGVPEFIARFQTPVRSLAAFEKSEFTDDWRELMRLFMVRRTRSFIKENYTQTDPENGRKYVTFSNGTRSYFPERMPKKLEYDFDSDDPTDQYAMLYSGAIVDSINGLNLPRYGLGNYVDELKKGLATIEELRIMDNLSRAGKRLMGFSRTNLFKRLESSGYSFLLSVARHILRNYIYVYAIQNGRQIPIGPQEANLFDDILDDMDIEGNDLSGNRLHRMTSEDDYYAIAEKVFERYETEMKKKFEWIRSELFISELKGDLLADSRNLLGVLKTGKDWDPDKDRQLNALFELCQKKHSTEKLLVFTQFADTANYLAEELRNRGMRSIECVTGEAEKPAEYAWRFSPEGSEKRALIKKEEEIRVLISTDVLSEGQNLQDCHIIINYDLPWAIIRLIQRAGRVDRIGQKAENILCYSVLPEEGLDRIINLRGRLRMRIKQNAEVVGSDETFFDGDPVNIEDLYNEKSGVLDEADSEVDPSSEAYEIWKKAIEREPSLAKKIPDLPNVVYGTKAIAPSIHDKEGVITYVRTADENDMLAWLDVDGSIVSQSQLRILRAAECPPGEKPLPKLEKHHELVEKAVRYVSDEEKLIGGQLGKKSGARYRVYMHLSRYCEEWKDSLFVTEALKRAVDEIYKYPLRETARDALNRLLKTGASDEDIVKLVLNLREDDKLCITADDETEYREPRIICSMGLKRSD